MEGYNVKNITELYGIYEELFYRCNLTTRHIAKPYFQPFRLLTRCRRVDYNIPDRAIFWRLRIPRFRFCLRLPAVMLSLVTSISFEDRVSFLLL
jgi:hypothetical protein